MSVKKMGNMRRIPNKDRKSYNACKEFISVFVEDESGAEDTERWLYFTPLEARRLPVWDCGAWGKDLKNGRLFPCGPASRRGYILPVNRGGKDVTLYVSAHTLARAEDRAEKNPESHAKRGVVRDFFD
jgi:hypothetical protein